MRQAEAGMRVVDLCRKHGISGATFYKWRAKYGGMAASDAMLLRQFEEENARLRKMVAEQALGHFHPRGCPVKKLLKPASCRQAVHYVQTVYTPSQRRACATLGVNRSAVRHPPPQDGDVDLRRRLRELAEERRRFGVQRLHVLLRREGLVVNHKRTERVYREECLSLRLRPTKKRPCVPRACLPTPIGSDEQWGTDFVSDSLELGRRIRILTILDLWNRSTPALEVSYYWTPLISLYSGMRLEEICQLSCKDIYEVDGIWVFNVNDSSNSSNDNKTLKNKSAIRIIPVHDELIKLGLLEYRKEIIKRGESRLFPELKKTLASPKYGKLPGKNFNRLIQSLGIEGKKSFHSLRHTFSQFFKEKNLHTDMFRQIFGHEIPELAGKQYGTTFTPKQCYDGLISKLDYKLDKHRQRN